MIVTKQVKRFEKLANTRCTVEYGRYDNLFGHNDNTISKDRFYDDNKKINSLSNYVLDIKLLDILKKIKNIY